MAVSNAKKYAVLAILMQRSTMVGIVGMGVTVLSVTGLEMDPQMELRLVEAMLLVTSITAILVQPKKKEGRRGDVRVDRGPDRRTSGRRGAAGSEDQEGRPRQDGTRPPEGGDE